MGRGYSPQFRRKVLDLVASGRRVADVASDVGISDQTIYNWRRQDRIDQGLESGLMGSAAGLCLMGEAGCELLTGEHLCSLEPVDS